MSESREPRFVGLVPMLAVTDVVRTIDFYQRLGFTVGNSHRPSNDAPPVWAWLHHGPAHIMVNQSEGTVEATHLHTSIWLHTADVPAAHADLAARGFDVGAIDYPFYNPDGEFHVHDPDGYAIFIAHAS